MKDKKQEMQNEEVKSRLTIHPISIDPRTDPPDEMKDIYNFEEI